MAQQGTALFTTVLVRIQAGLTDLCLQETRSAVCTEILICDLQKTTVIAGVTQLKQLFQTALLTKTTDLTDIIFCQTGTALAAKMILIGIVLCTQTTFRASLVFTAIHTITADITFFRFIRQKTSATAFTGFTAIHAMRAAVRTPAGIFQTGIAKLAVTLLPAVFTESTV